MHQKNDQNDKIIKVYKDIGPYLGLGTQLAASIILMFFLGRWLDEKFSSAPYLTIFFSFFGGFAGIYNLIKSTININSKKKSE